MDGDGIAGLHGLEELVAENVDRDDSAPVPDIVNEQPGGGNGVDVPGEQHRLRSDAQFAHAHQCGAAQRGAHRLRRADDRPTEVLLVQLFVARVRARRRVITIDNLGDEFLETVKTGDPIAIHKDGTVEVG